MAIVTVSASYGAGGSVIAPRVAHQLGMPFVDRAIPVDVARELGISVEDAEALSQNATSTWWSVLARISTLSNGWAVPIPNDAVASETELIECTEKHLRHLADTHGCVVLGHAAAVVFAERVDAVHVRLDGPPEGRVHAAMRQHGIDQDAAATAQKENDRLRTGYVRHFYRRDPSSPDLYHLTLDTVRLTWNEAEQIIVAAARLITGPT